MDVGTEGEVHLGKPLHEASGGKEVAATIHDIHGDGSMLLKLGGAKVFPGYDQLQMVDDLPIACLVHDDGLQGCGTLLIDH